MKPPRMSVKLTERDKSQVKTLKRLGKCRSKRNGKRSSTIHPEHPSYYRMPLHQHKPYIALQPTSCLPERIISENSPLWLPGTLKVLLTTGMSDLETLEVRPNPANTVLLLMLFLSLKRVLFQVKDRFYTNNVNLMFL